MAFNIAEDPANSLIVIRFNGAVDNEEMMQMMDQLYRSEHYSTSNQLIDFTQVERFLVTPDGVQTYNETAFERTEKTKADKERKIVICAPADLTFGMSRLFSSIAARGGVDLMVVRELDAAFKYLNFDKNADTP